MSVSRGTALVANTESALDFWRVVSNGTVLSIDLFAVAALEPLSIDEMLLSDDDAETKLSVDDIICEFLPLQWNEMSESVSRSRSLCAPRRLEISNVATPSPL
jgi:hypothetical protein